eukprot:m.310141 g.310141  ORF g.310141 m.310141 type:complete len:84 (-) comp16474_c0_seq27:459-710(-)
MQTELEDKIQHIQEIEADTQRLVEEKKKAIKQMNSFKSKFEKVKQEAKKLKTKDERVQKLKKELELTVTVIIFLGDSKLNNDF